MSIVPAVQSTLVPWKAPGSFTFFKNPYFSLLTEAADSHCTLGTPLCRWVQATRPEMMPASSGAPGMVPRTTLIYQEP